MSYSSLNQNVTWMKNRQPVCMLPRHCELKASPWIAPWHYEELGKTWSAEFLWVWKTSPTGPFQKPKCVLLLDPTWRVFQLKSFSSYLSDFDMHKLWAAGTVGLGFSKDVCFIDPSRAFVWNHYAKELLFTGFWTMPTDLHLGNEHLLTTFPLGFLLFSAYIYTRIYIYISHDFCVYIWLRAYIH